MTGPPGVEDPISAIFDLSDRVAEMVPVVRRMYRYTATILVIWIVLMAFVALLTFAAIPYVSVLAVVGLVAGAIALSLLRRTDRFFRSFVQRHRSIRLLRDADPVVQVPEGRTPIERLARYLTATSAVVDGAVRENPGIVRYRSALPGAGRTIPFDLVIEQPGGGLARALGLGARGFTILARLGPERPSVGELAQLEADAVAVAPRLRGAPSRLILLRPVPGALSEDAYEYTVGHPVIAPWGPGGTRLNLEIITENPDRTYDFVPHVLGVP